MLQLFLFDIEKAALQRVAFLFEVNTFLFE